MEYSEEELRVPGFKDFPADLNPDVCPTLAITVNGKALPSIQPERCIACGLCASRCPVGAIRIDTKLGAVITEKVNDQVFPLATSTNEIRRTRTMLASAARVGRLVTESDKLLTTAMTKIEAIGDVTTQFPNHLSRNLLMAVGIPTAMRRRGDVNLRMDLVMQNGVAEVEYMRQALLDSPRNVLDNVAVVVSRYGMPMANLVPLIVSIGLPNQRGEYWQVINDAATVLNLKIRSLTAGALLVLVWSGTRLKFNGDLFYTQPEMFSIRRDVEKAIGRKLQISDGLLALFESSK
jgi:ferredoxin